MASQIHATLSPRLPASKSTSLPERVRVSLHRSYVVVYKLGGRLFSCKQDHTPLDVVAWHGTYVPYKYALEKFVNVASISKDHIDPSIFCILTAKSKIPHHALMDLLIFSPRWDVANYTFQPPYYHQNNSTEFMGVLYGNYGGRSDDFQSGGASYETGFCRHGEGHEANLSPMRIHEGTIAFMFESSQMLPSRSTRLNAQVYCTSTEPQMWDGLRAQFVDHHLDEVNAELRTVGAEEVKVKAT